MREINNRNKTINYSSLKRTKFAENYALTLQELYSDIASVPHFNDEEVMLACSKPLDYDCFINIDRNVHQR